MISDIDIKYYYAKFIEKSKEDLAECIDVCKKNVDIKTKSYNVIKDNVDVINNYLCLNIHDLSCEDEILPIDYKYVKNKIAVFNIKINSSDEKVIILNFIKYLQAIKFSYANNKKLAIASKKRNITMAEYKRLVKKFYNYGVMKCILEGNAYHINGGLGDIICSRWRNTSKTKRINFNETNKKKREILNAGLKLYDEKEAEIYKLRNIKYDGVPYKIYKNDDYIYIFNIINSSRFKNINVKFEHKDRIERNLRGKTQEQIAKECNSLEDVYNLVCDLNHKLGVLLKYEPMSYLNFIRNAEQNKFNNGAHNSKNRQRFQS